MATANAYGGQLDVTMSGTVTFTGDSTGGRTVAPAAQAVTFHDVGGDDPTASGLLFGEFTATTTPTDLLLTDADPFQGLGDGSVVYEDGFPAGGRVKLLHVKNCAETGNLKVTRPANGLPIFTAAGDQIVLPPGAFFTLYLPEGTDALVGGSNDALQVEASAGEVDAELFVIFGP